MSHRRAVAVGLSIAALISACDGEDEGAVTPPSSSVDASDESSNDPGSDDEGGDDDSAANPQGPSTSVDDAGGEASPVTTSPAPTSLPAEDDDGGVAGSDGVGGETLGPLGSTVVDLESDQGTVQIGEATVPTLAAQFPLPDGLELQLASETTTDAGFSGTASGTVLENAAFYREALEPAGFAILSERRPTGDDDPDPPVVLFSFESDRLTGDIAISSAPGGVGSSIIVTIAER